MGKKDLIYWCYGGFLLLTSSIAFIYFTLFGYKATIVQWLSAVILGVIGAVFLLIADEKQKKS